MTTVHRLPTRAVKLTIPIAVGDFPVAAIPRPGTPGGKGVIVEVMVETPDGVLLSASLKGSGLQKLLAAIEAAPQEGGFVVLQGKLSAGGVIGEAGVIFQPGKVERPSQEAGQMPEHRGP